jgi:hypothetical protein
MLQLDEALALLRSLPTDKALEYGRRIITYTTLQLDEVKLVFNDDDEQVCVTICAEHL